MQDPPVGSSNEPVEVINEDGLRVGIAYAKREIVRNPKSDEYRKALKGTGKRLPIAKQILAREEARASHSP